MRTEPVITMEHPVASSLPGYRARRRIAEPAHIGAKKPTYLALSSVLGATAGRGHGAAACVDMVWRGG
jgi:hypothetical protein